MVALLVEGCCECQRDTHLVHVRLPGLDAPAEAPAVPQALDDDVEEAVVLSCGVAQPSGWHHCKAVSHCLQRLLASLLRARDILNARLQQDMQQAQ